MSKTIQTPVRNQERPLRLLLKCSVCHNSGHNRRSLVCPGPEQETVEDPIHEDQGEDTEEAEDAGDIEEEENIFETSCSQYAFHFVDETEVDD